MASSVYVILNAVALINIILLVTFLCWRKNNVLPNYILSIILSIPGLYLADNILIGLDLLKAFPYSFFAVQLIANLFPILVFYYTHLLLPFRKKYNFTLLIGSIISISYCIGMTIYFSMLTQQDQEVFLSKLSQSDYPMIMNLYNVIFYVWQMVYLFVISREIKSYQTLVENSLTDTSSVKLTFIKNFITLLTILNCVLVVFYLSLPTPLVDYGVLPVTVTIIYIFIIYFTIKNNALFDSATYEKLVIENDTILDLAQDNKDHHDDAKTLDIASKLETVLFEQKLYKNPTLKLSEIAEIINEPPYVVSRVINSHFNQTFFDLINGLRIKESISMLRNFDPKTEKIETIAYEAGFNSRASFYRAFKKSTGKNPSHFIPNS